MSDLRISSLLGTVKTIYRKKLHGGNWKISLTFETEDYKEYKIEIPDTSNPLRFLKKGTSFTIHYSNQFCCIEKDEHQLNSVYTYYYCP